ncbi:O-antigen ligase family protein [Streptomyces apocyni]|uniref:O-antigen ligase family protein n=1 Tax=Streptomyces apocyni TaxID=2654677 RepID=UPI0012EA665B|nr:O-antigen ligase family protein [Streptomyces apocyni]
MASAMRPGLRQRRTVADATGVAVLGACATWSLVTAAAGDGRPEGVLLAVLAVGAGYASGRICGALVPAAACGAAALGALALAAASSQGVPGGGAASPLGYTGAAAALLILAAGAACCGAWATGRPPARLVLRLLAAAVAGAALALDSMAGFVGAAGVLLCSLAAARVRYRALGLAGFALVTVVLAGVSWAVAEDVLPDGLTVSLEDQLTQHRVLLWQDALTLAKDDPALGAGPGTFGELSATAQQSVHADGKPHSAPLQQAAEQGVVGAVLLASVFGWLLYALWCSSRATPMVLTAAATLTALAALAAVGNALSFTPVTAGAGLLAGLATAWPMGEELAPPLDPAGSEETRPWGERS